VTRRAEQDERFMGRALALALRGQGHVEPNPMVGCVIAQGTDVVGEGLHERFGGPHAEINALTAAAGRAAGATAYVTLEPCCHHGKTPPCTQALLSAGVKRVVAAVEDPFPEVAGRGVAELRAGGVECDIGVRATEANWLLAPYRKLLSTGRPWVIAKWAMTLDGKLATRTGDSQWISSEASRAVVHQLRGRVDAIVVGSGTARIDNPLLTARPADRAELKRVATRIVVDSAASLSSDSRLAQTAGDVPVLVAASSHTDVNACERLASAGIEIYRCAGENHAERLRALLDELGRRRITNMLVEGGSRLLGVFFDVGAVDEVHVFISPKLTGGTAAPSPIAGAGAAKITDSLQLADITIEELDGDVYVHGRLNK
jgi:diaminohydroxyphosphoribosylaminopyrimidine deaminase / 5-amino-6-(5-phosphoribosylamino)uracil reductase